MAIPNTFTVPLLSDSPPCSGRDVAMTREVVLNVSGSIISVYCQIERHGGWLNKSLLVNRGVSRRVSGKASNKEAEVVRALSQTEGKSIMPQMPRYIAVKLALKKHRLPCPPAGQVSASRRR